MLDAARGRRRTIVIGGRLDEPDVLPPDRLNAIRVAGFFMNWACGLKLYDTQSGIPLLSGRALRRHPGAPRRLRVRDRGAGRRRRARLARSRGSRRRPRAGAPAEPLPPDQRRRRDRRLSGGHVSSPAGRSRPGRWSPRWRSRSTASAGACATRPLWSRRRCTPARPRCGRWPSASSAIQHVVNRVALWRRDPRPRRALVAAQATAAAPVLLGLCSCVQAFAPRRMPDVVSPLVRWLCSRIGSTWTERISRLS